MNTPSLSMVLSHWCMVNELHLYIYRLNLL
nr:MAG TPA: hypothetical protein [Caudoviricetes sp.]